MIAMKREINARVCAVDGSDVIANGEWLMDFSDE